MTGGLHCPCGLPAFDENVSVTEETTNVTLFEKFTFVVKARRFHCAKCGYISVSAYVDNPYEPLEGGL